MLGMFRIGQGIDFHRFTSGNSITLGGVVIPHTHSLLGHSDADVLVHSIMDALLGAAGLLDIGHYFPDSDQKFKNISSCELLKIIMGEIGRLGYTIGNVDSTILAEVPKISPYISEMKQTLCSILKVSTDQLGIKATTTETMGSVGRKEGVVASSVCILFKN